MMIKTNRKNNILLCLTAIAMFLSILVNTFYDLTENKLCVSFFTVGKENFVPFENLIKDAHFSILIELLLLASIFILCLVSVSSKKEKVTPLAVLRFFTEAVSYVFIIMLDPHGFASNFFAKPILPITLDFIFIGVLTVLLICSAKNTKLLKISKIISLAALAVNLLCFVFNFVPQRTMDIVNISSVVYYVSTYLFYFGLITSKMRKNQ